MARVVIENTGEAFDCPPDTALLDAALAAGLFPPHSCRGAQCGTCKAEVLEGRVDHGWNLSLAITDEEQAGGFCLTCQAKPLSEALRLRYLLPWPERDPGEVTPPAELDAEVVAAHPVAPTVRRLVLALPPDASFRFAAGMNIELQVPGLDKPRPYSMANINGEGVLEFFISRHPHGRASGWVHDQLAVGVPVRIRGPYGSFAWPPGEGAVTALAGGTGLSPILSVIRKALAEGFAVPIELLFSVRSRPEAFALDALTGLARRHPNFHWRVTLTRDAAAVPPWLQGRVPEVLAREAWSGTSRGVLIAGSPGFVADCSAAAIAQGADPARVVVDSFTPTA
jgi:CDP-4-dehydro-6-deoxyglucose reductase